MKSYKAITRNKWATSINMIKILKYDVEWKSKFHTSTYSVIPHVSLKTCKNSLDIVYAYIAKLQNILRDDEYSFSCIFNVLFVINCFLNTNKAKC